MSNISSNSLFHFTKKREHLINILTKTFIPRYSFEEVKLSNVLKKANFENAIPMVCFCDISLSQINKHIKTYGQYGIGMTKEWGIKNKLNPIIYINPDSNISESLNKMAENINQVYEEQKTDSIDSIADEYLNIMKFLKPYTGYFKKDENIYQNKRFYNEREWRYVPKISFDSKVKSTLNRVEFDNEKILRIENEKLIEYKLHFEPSDIKYIFVKNENDIHQMMVELRKIKHRFSTREIDILTSKITTTEQIIEDF
jgi:hypothetical protein